MSVNKVILVGRLGQDPEVRNTGSGQSVANFQIATDETFKDRSGEKQKRTEWHRLVVWGKPVAFVEKYLHKGDLVFVEGKIQTREWEDREGNKKTAYEIIVSNIRALQTDRSKQDQTQTRTQTQPQQEVSDEDIPF